MAKNNIKKECSTEKRREKTCLCPPFVILLVSMIKFSFYYHKKRTNLRVALVINNMNNSLLNV